ncbi:MAG: ABC transporter ATP-binding protein [Planctomycetales bacterium]|nr:ABC transporter ATP-binding protein [Planctomycetales bacterium]
MSNAIRLNHVTKRFGSQLALDDVSLEVAPGTVFALLGENGAGKSTTIRLLLGLAEPDSGQASVFGMESVTHSLEIRRCVGYVAERPTLYDWMTVDEIGWFTAGFYGGNFLPTYKSLIEQFSLPSNKKLKTLSKGMRAKVALALSMGHDPDLLILDEPTSGLDTMVRREFLESMVDRAASGKTVFLSSHQIHEVERVADVVGIMRQGKMIVVERLEKLKAEVQEFTVTLADASAVPPLIAGELLRQRRRARQWQLLVRNGPHESLQQLSDRESIENVEVRTPSLEEIFVAYMRHDGGGAATEEIEQLV